MINPADPGFDPINFKADFKEWVRTGTTPAERGAPIGHLLFRYLVIAHGHQGFIPGASGLGVVSEDNDTVQLVKGLASLLYPDKDIYEDPVPLEAE